MAKKKVSHQDKPSQNRTAAAMDEASEKLESLKSLNSMLLKETVERRQQVDSLLHSNGSLEMELTRSNSEKTELLTELTRLGELGVLSEMERDLVDLYVGVQVGQLVEGLVKEKSESEGQVLLLEKKLGEVMSEIEDVRRVSDFVRRERDEARNEVEKLRMKCDGLVVEYEERQRTIELLVKEKDVVQRCVAVLRKEIEDGKREKEAMERERDVEVVRRNDLEQSVRLLEDMVVELREEGDKLRGNVLVLEGKCREGEDKLRGMAMEIGVLMAENKSMDKSLKGLVDEKSLIMKELERVLSDFEDEKSMLKEVAKEKCLLEEAKEKGEREIVVLKRDVLGLKGTIQWLEERGRGEMVKIRGLECEVDKYNDAFDRLTDEKDEFRSGLEEEKMNGMKLREKISEMEKSVEETETLLGKMRDEKRRLVEHNKELEGKNLLLKHDLASVESELVESQNELSIMKAKVGQADSTSEVILKMLRSTATLVSRSINEGEMVSDQVIGEEEIKAYVAELEAIKNAVKSRDSVVEDMKRQLQSLQHSEAAHKKGFWTLLTSATTLFAAASVAYVARGTK